MSNTITKNSQAELWFSGNMYNKPIISLSCKRMQQLRREIDNLGYTGDHVGRLVAEKELEVEKQKAEMMYDYLGHDFLSFLEAISKEESMVKIRTMIKKKKDFVQMQREVWELKR